jgi:RNA polymerase sigma factor (sigma-70 family)
MLGACRSSLPCDAITLSRQLRDVSETTQTRPRPRKPPKPPGAGQEPAGADAAAEFERLYRAQVNAVTAYFARRSADPQTVADLTADTFVRAISSFGSYDPDRGSGRAWLFGIARRIYAGHCEASSRQHERVARLAGRRELEPDQVGELLDRIDAERVGRGLVTELAALPAPDRALVELVDLAGFAPREAAAALGLSAGAARMRLMRARARLRKSTDHTRSKGND